MLTLPHLVRHTQPLPLWGRERLLAWTARATNAHGHANLMAQAGWRSAQLALALHPHAQRIWVACGTGHNGQDGWYAAHHLAQWGRQVTVTALGPAPAGLDLSQLEIGSEAPSHWELGIDALFGLGLNRPLTPDHPAFELLMVMHRSPSPLLHLDLPSGLCPSTGTWLGPPVRPAAGPRATLALLGLSLGLWTHQGRDFAGSVWLSTLDSSHPAPKPDATLLGEPPPRLRPHHSHKGAFGRVWVLGGGAGMRGAATLAARSALTHGAGLVLWHDPTSHTPDSLPWACAAIQTRQQPPDTWRAHEVAIVGCGAGQVDARIWSSVWANAPQLVLDADALNALAQDPALVEVVQKRKSRPMQTVMTPHPLEAARLLGISTEVIQRDRPQAAAQLAQRFGCTVVLKGSGTVLASPTGALSVNPTGNARLATAGSGDVLAGYVGALLAQGLSSDEAAQEAVFAMGRMAETADTDTVLTADQQALGEASDLTA
jgi:hydroxyethylthiazole kinase-like uncharacterized protein yjeF